MNMDRVVSGVQNVITIARGREMVARGLRRSDVVSMGTTYEVDKVHGDGKVTLSRFDATSRRQVVTVPITALDPMRPKW
mgnify:CR=1 FL=1